MRAGAGEFGRRGQRRRRGQLRREWGGGDGGGGGRRGKSVICGGGGDGGSVGGAGVVAVTRGVVGAGGVMEVETAGTGGMVVREARWGRRTPARHLPGRKPILRRGWKGVRGLAFG